MTYQIEVKRRSKWVTLPGPGMALAHAMPWSGGPAQQPVRAVRYTPQDPSIWRLNRDHGFHPGSPWHINMLIGNVGPTGGWGHR